MSAEFQDNSPREIYNDEYAIEAFNNALELHRPLTEFLKKIVKDYDAVEDGHVAILQMLRVARFITQQPDDQMTEETVAFMHGELIASQLLNYIHPTSAPVGELANSYMKTHLKQSIDSIKPESEVVYDEMTQEYIRKSVEKRTHQLQRLANLAIKLRTTLSDDEVAALPSEALEEFIASITQQLFGENSDLSTYMKSGFRLIFNEYPLPFSSHQITTAPNNSNRVSSNTLSQITNLRNEKGDIDTLVPADDISYVQANFLKQFNDIYSKFSQIDTMDETLILAIFGRCRTELETFNRRYEFIKQKDFLFISGDYIAQGVEEEGSDLIRLQPNIEIRGEFAGISIVQVPSNKEFLKKINKEFDSDDYRTLVPSPAIQIKNPVVVMYTGEGEPAVQYGQGITLNIPLIYKNIDIQRLRALDLED